MATCSRCGSRWPNAACPVCAEEDPPERDWFDARREYEEGLGDYLRDQMIDRQMEREREESANQPTP